MDIINRSNEDEGISIDIMELLRVVLHNAVFIVICTLVVGIAAYAATYFLVTPMYRANITLYVNNSASKENNNGLSQSDLNASAHLVDTYAAIIKSESVTEKVIEDAKVDITPKALLNNISTSAVNNTEVFKVYVKNANPEVAARIANAIADTASDKIADIVEGSSVKIVDYAAVPTKIDSPNYTRNAMIGALAGFVVSIAFFILRALQDNSIRSATDFERWNFPVLVSIPDLGEAEKSSHKGYGYSSYAYGSKSRKSTGGTK